MTKTKLVNALKKRKVDPTQVWNEQLKLNDVIVGARGMVLFDQLESGSLLVSYYSPLLGESVILTYDMDNEITISELADSIIWYGKKAYDIEMRLKILSRKSN